MSRRKVCLSSKGEKKFSEAGKNANHSNTFEDEIFRRRISNMRRCVGKFHSSTTVLFTSAVVRWVMKNKIICELWEEEDGKRLNPFLKGKFLFSSWSKWVEFCVSCLLGSLLLPCSGCVWQRIQHHLMKKLSGMEKSVREQICWVMCGARE